ncbi:ArsR/SmtB family transcription factor [Kribbella catacumbae]|uniref:ArsR/SmtB family transcription factor n=1 Tax=Kribbella catacumbae TaxID=460086 RepID=UPI00037E2A9A|nr:helix-turn-helix domain-containing protein [Kribbella catacumbae]
MLRIHFSADDLAQVTVAAEPDPLWEVLLSLHMLQVSDGLGQFGSWRHRTHRHLSQESVGSLLVLAPPVGYSPDFLTPAAAGGSPCIAEAIDEMLSAPSEVIKRDLSLLATPQPAKAWVRQLAEARSETLIQLGDLVRRYHRVAIEPYWPQIRARIRADYRIRAELLAADGVDGLLAGLHSRIRWRPPALELSDFPAGDIYLDGRGLRLQPSYFCWDAPTKLRNEGLAPVLVYPVQDQTGPLEVVTQAGQAPRGARALAATIGRSRALTLELSREGCTTTQVAAHCGISLSAASYQTAVLRGAGLLESRRDGRSVNHQATPLGLALLDRNT